MRGWVVAACCLPVAALASPTTFVHQGRLVDTLGAPIEGQQTLLVELYTQPTGGTRVWHESDPATLRDGYYAIQLGDTNPLDTLNFGTTAYFLQVTPVGGSPILPRTQIAAVPVALSVAGGLQPTAVTTTQRDALQVQPGAVVYNTTEGQLQTYTTSGWSTLAAGSSSGSYAWGRGAVGGLGTGDTASRNYPTEIAVPGGVRFETITAGGYNHGSEPGGCAIDTAGRLFCWGRGNNVPDGESEDMLAPKEVSNGLQWRDVDMGFGLVTCGITVSGVGYCWGREDYNGLGNGLTGSDWFYTPQQLLGNISWKTLRPGGRYNDAHRAWTCGVSTAVGEDNGYCWGIDSYGVLGNGSAGSNYNSPETGLIPGFEWQDIQPGSYHSCGVTVSGEGYCWGEGGSGRLGYGSTGDQQQPALVSGGHTWQKIEAGEAHSCGLDDAGAIWCWGDSSQYQLGRGTTTDSSVPVAVTDPSSDPVGNPTVWTDLRVGYQHSCALDSEYAMWCWGRGDDGRQGDLGSGENGVPTRVQGELRFRDFATGIRQTYGIQR